VGEMLEKYKVALKGYSIADVGVIVLRMFLKKKGNPIEFTALIPTFIYLCNI
jgi:hypothetical protein